VARVKADEVAKRLAKAIFILKIGFILDYCEKKRALT
jgi:hypothetical protein